MPDERTDGPAARTDAPIPAPQRGPRLRSAVAAAGRVSLQMLAVTAAVVVVGYVLGVVWPVLLPLVFALLITTFLWPLAAFLRRHRWPPALAASTVVAGFLALLAAVVWLVVPPLVDQSGAVVDGIVSGLEQVHEWSTGPPLDLDDAQIGQAADQAIDALRNNLEQLTGAAVSTLTAVGSGVVNAALALVITFFFLKDGDRWLPWLGAQTSLRAAPHVAEVSRRGWRTLSGFISAQALIGLADALGIAIGMLILDVPLVLPLTILIFFGAFVPIVGAFVTGAVAVLIALVSNGFTTALILLAVVLVVQAIEGNVLEPWLQGQSLNLHPVVILLAVSAGGTFQGILGALLAVPIAALVAVVYRYGRDLLDERATPPSASAADS